MSGWQTRDPSQVGITSAGGNVSSIDFVDAAGEVWTVTVGTDGQLQVTGAVADPGTFTGTIVQNLPSIEQEARSSEEFSPSDIDDLFSWWDAGTLTLNDDDAVTQWDDLSTTANNATQGTSSLQPTFKTNQINSLPAVRFASDQLNTGVAKALRPVTAFAVVKSNNVGNNRVLIGATTGGVDAGSFGWRHNASKQNLLREGVEGVGTSTTNLTSSQWQLWDVTWDSSGHEFGLDGSNDGSGSAGGAPTSRAIRIGARANESDRWDGDIAEIIVYDRALTSSERGDVRNYLLTKYGL